MTITTGQNANASDFINEAGRNATPSNDVGRVAKMESDGRQHPFFTRNGTVLDAGETINGATLPVPVFQNKSDNEIYACDANDNTRYKFIGFAISNSTDGNSIGFQGSGVVNGFSALAEGEKYYVQDTAGTIGTSPGTQAILVGIAISTTELLIQKGPQRAGGEGTVGTATGSNAITCGFRPSVIRISARSTFNTQSTHTMEFKWVNGSVYVVASFNDSSSLVSNEPRLYGGNSTSYMEFSITSVTDTGFTISWTETNTFSPDDEGYVWEAEGEL